MTIILEGDRNAVRQQIIAAVERAGWRLELADSGPTRLVPPDGEGAPGGWLLLQPESDAWRATFWLPDEGSATARETLEGQLDGLLATSAGDAAVLRRLRRIEGQIRGLQRMIDGERDCEAILTQFAAASVALKQTAAHVVSAHLVECIRAELERGGEPAALNQRLLNVLF